MLASAAFSRIDVSRDSGRRRSTSRTTQSEHGVAAAPPAEVGIAVCGRGERASPSVTQQSLRFLMINRTPRESLPATARTA